VKVINRGRGNGRTSFSRNRFGEEFLEEKSGSPILFIGTKKGLEAKVLSGLGFALQTIDVEVSREGGSSALRRLCSGIPKSFIQSFRIIRLFSPDLVIGVGGYASDRP